MPFTVEYNAEPDNAHGDAAGVSSALAAQRGHESFATEAEAVDFITRLPPLRDPVLVMEDGERMRGPALSLHLVQWQANDAH
jgi:hypothetical protein